MIAAGSGHHAGRRHVPHQQIGKRTAGLEGTGVLQQFQLERQGNGSESEIGAIARPDDLFFASELPKTRSAKIMRRLLRDIAEGRILGDTTTLADPAVVTRLKAQYQEEG